MANGVWSTAREPVRGGATARAFATGKPLTAGGASHNGVAFERRYTEKELWANWEYFITRVIIAASKSRACWIMK